jgi:NHL repeat
MTIFGRSSFTTPVARFKAGMSGPVFLAFDHAGNLYVDNYDGNNVTEYTPPFTNGSVAMKTFGSALTLSHPYDVAVDGLGDVYVADYGNDNVVEYT